MPALIALLLTAFVMRGPVTGVGPVAAEVVAAYGTTWSLYGMLAALPVAAFGLCSFLAPALQARLGLCGAASAALGLLLLGTALRFIANLAAFARLCCRWSCAGGDALSSLPADGFAYEGQSSHARRIDALPRHRVSGCRCGSFHLRPAFAGNGRLDGAVRFLHCCHIALGIVRSTGRYPSNDRLAVFKRKVIYCFLKKKYFSTIVS